jgi:hypothetical protein
MTSGVVPYWRSQKKRPAGALAAIALDPDAP